MCVRRPVRAAKETDDLICIEASFIWKEEESW